MREYPMYEDVLIGDGGNLAVYERPDGSRYALDGEGRGHELCWGEGILGPARFDSRALSDGRWPGSRSRIAVPVRA
jgi:hypothetical protein